MAQAFHLFPWFPRELRDAIWRACLPHRVVEIDIPFGYVSTGIWQFGDGEDEPRHVDEEARGCYMESTTRINSVPPIITRVCRESWMVAFETGRLLRNRHRKRTCTPDISPHVDQQWFDQARDTIHLHYTDDFQYDRLVRARGNPIAILHERAASHRVPASLTHDFITDIGNATEWLKSMALLEDLEDVSVCLRVVCIHVNEGPAVRSGLFGTLGEERVVLADALDHELISRFRAVCKTHGLCHDPLTEEFFETYKSKSLVVMDRCHRFGGSVQGAMEKIQVALLVSKSHIHHAKASEGMPEDIWESCPAEFSVERYVPIPASQCIPGGQRLVPDLHHPWVKEACSQMPKFRPTVMFRLCTGDCMNKWSRD